MIPRLARLAVSAFALLFAIQAQERTDLEAKYRETANRLIDAALADSEGYAKLAYLTDRIGNRLSGSESLNQAIRWAAEQMRKDGLTNVVTPPVKVPHWVRGRESAALLSPVQRNLPLLGLGGSVGTPVDGITAEVVPVASFEDLEKLGREKVQGKFVLFNVPYQGYGRTVTYRTTGASRAAKFGAVGMLLRSVGSRSLQTPHTGMMTYAADAPKIPAAALTIEDAQLLQRLTDAGEKVTVRLSMEARTLPDADSANVIGELPGRERPEEVVVLGGHIDSWDIGTGAQDDGSGCVAALQAVALMKKLGLQPRRTVRVAFWTNEENGTAGGRAYRQWAGAKVKQHVAAIEMDGGAEKPVGFGVSLMGSSTPAGAADRALQTAKSIGSLLERVGANQITAGGGGADIAAIMQEGVPGLGLRTVGTHYFDWHHTPADTIDKIDPAEFRQNIAALAVMAYVLADMPGKLGE